MPISAHYLTYLVKKKFRDKIDKTETLGRSYRNYSYEQLAWLIEHNNDWKLFWEYDRSVDQMWKIMYGIFLQAIDEICPIHALRYEKKKEKKKRRSQIGPREMLDRRLRQNSVV